MGGNHVVTFPAKGGNKENTTKQNIRELVKDDVKRSTEMLINYKKCHFYAF